MNRPRLRPRLQGADLLEGLRVRTLDELEAHRPKLDISVRPVSSSERKQHLDAMGSLRAEIGDVKAAHMRQINLFRGQVVEAWTESRKKTIKDILVLLRHADFDEAYRIVVEYRDKHA